MNKRGQESVPVLSAYGLVKTIIAVVLMLLVIGIVAVACGFISLAGLDSGTKRTFEWMSDKIYFMSNEGYRGQERYDGNKKYAVMEETFPIGSIKEGLAIVWFDVNQLEINVDGTSVRRPLECEGMDRYGCLAICSVDSIEYNSCSGSKLLGKKVLFDSALNYDGKGFSWVGPKKGEVVISKDDKTKKLSISF